MSFLLPERGAVSMTTDQNFVIMEPQFWGTIITAMADAQDLVVREGRPVEFKFNGITVRVAHETKLELLLRDYHTAFLLDWSIIGPYTQDEYTDELKAQISEVEQAREKQRAEQQRIWYQERETALKALETQINGVEFAIKPRSETALRAWRANNESGYGRAIIEYAMTWARLMQSKISRGYRLKDIASLASHEADTDGITGFMFGAAVRVLSDVWVYGDDLRIWHNARYVESFWDTLNEGSIREAFCAWQRHYTMEHNGGVINPAIITISV
jgi:hypothetical protein